MTIKWTDLGPPPEPGDPGLPAWVNAFNAEADAWIAECEAREEEAKRRISHEFLQIANRHLNHIDAILGANKHCLFPQNKKVACEIAISDIWQAIDQLRGSRIYDIERFSRRCYLRLERLKSFLDIVPEPYFRLLVDEIEEAESFVIRSWEKLMISSQLNC